MEKKNIIESANQVLNSISKSMKAAGKEYKSISCVLKDIQRRNLMAAGYSECFAAVGLATDGKVTPAQIFALTEAAGLFVPVTKGKGADKKTENVAAIWVERTNKETGETTVKLQKVTSWTDKKLFTLIAQAKA